MLLHATFSIVALAASTLPPLTDVFTSGPTKGLAWIKDGTQVTYRIPSLIAVSRQKLLLTASQRIGSSNDESATNLVTRSSIDGGATWGPMKLAVSTNSATVTGMSSAPWSVALWRRSGGRAPANSAVQLFWNANSTTSPSSKCNCGVATAKSIDGGATWSAPTVAAGISGSSLASGIVLTHPPHAGRIVLCMRKICKNSCPANYSSFASWSDDGGVTWNSSAHLPPGTTECQIAEINDGSGTLYMSIRSLHAAAGATHKRISSRSFDGGVTWTAPTAEPALPDAGGCAGSVVSGADAALYYSHPNANGRTNMSVWSSADGGKSWGAPTLLYGGGSAYSSLVMMQAAQGEIGLAFEKDHYKSIAFTTMSLATLATAKKEDQKTTTTTKKTPTKLLFYTCATKEIANQCDESFSLDQAGIANAGFSKNLTLISEGAALGITTLFSVHDTFFENGAGMRPDWRSAWAALLPKLDPLIRTKAIVGFFIGDELFPGKISVQNFTACLNVLSEAKVKYAALGLPLVTWENEGGTTWTSFFNGSGIPSGLDIISMDDYYMSSDGTPKGEAEGHRKWYTEVLYPLLKPHQRVFLVPGAFATHNPAPGGSGHYPKGNETFCYDGTYEGCDQFMADQANAFAEWAWSDDRVAGFAPWHWDSRTIPEVSPYKEVGVVDMPKTKAAYKKIGERMRREGERNFS